MDLESIDYFIKVAASALRDALVLQAAQSLADEIGVMRPAT